MSNQEPVAWWHDKGDYVDLNVSGHGIPLYTHPAPLQNEFAKTTSWQVLSDDEIQDAWYKLYPLDKNNLWDDMMIGKHLDKFARAIEQELKRKNGFSDVKEKNYG